MATRWLILVISQCGIINIATHRDDSPTPPTATTNTTLTDLHTHIAMCVYFVCVCVCVCCVNSPAVHALSHVSGATEVVWVLRLLIINVVALYVTRSRLDSTRVKARVMSAVAPPLVPSSIPSLVFYFAHSAINLQPFSSGKIFLMLCKVREFCFSLCCCCFFFCLLLLLLLVLCVAQPSWRPLTL